MRRICYHLKVNRHQNLTYSLFILDYLYLTNVLNFKVSELLFYGTSTAKVIGANMR